MPCRAMHQLIAKKGCLFSCGWEPPAYMDTLPELIGVKLLLSAA